MELIYSIVFYKFTDYEVSATIVVYAQNCLSPNLIYYDIILFARNFLSDLLGTML